MRTKLFNKNLVKRVHFLGIGGISMSAMAKHLYQKGFIVSGSDKNEKGAKQILKGYNIPVNDFTYLQNCDLVVVSSAISKNDKELKFAQNLGKRIIKRAELLRKISALYKTFIGVAGTHGKTTSTCMIAHILKSANLPFTAHIGGEDNQFSNFVNLGDQIFLSEVCEYKKNISYISSDIALVLNVDNDHIESYKTFDALFSEFESYLKRARIAVVWDKSNFLNLKNAVTFSVDNPLCDYYLHTENNKENCGESVVYEHREPLFKINLSDFSPQNKINFIACVAVCRSLKICCNDIVNGVKSFSGVKRRNELLFDNGKNKVIADYAHHPTQISLAINNYKSLYGDRVKFIFQPHTYSRTQILFNDFISALNLCDKPYIYKTYGARERYCEESSAFALSKAVKNSVFLNDEKSLESVVNQLIDGDKVIIVLGAGDIYYLVKDILSKLKSYLLT